MTQITGNCSRLVLVFVFFPHSTEDTQKNGVSHFPEKETSLRSTMLELHNRMMKPILEHNSD